MSYDIQVYNAFGDEYLRSVHDFENFECARSLNNVGKFSLDLPMTDPEFSFWQQDMTLRVHRQTKRRSNLVGNTIWYVDKVEYDWNKKLVTVSGHDTLGLLQRYVVAYTKGTSYAEKTLEFGLLDFGSNLMKQFLRENIGSLALDTTRILSYITIPADDDLGAVCEKEASFADLLSVCKDIADQSASGGTILCFDLVPDVNNRLTFRVVLDTLGVDRRTEPHLMVFSPELNNLIDPVMTRDFSIMVNTAYLGGDGEDAGRLIVKAQNPVNITGRSPYAKREKFFDEKDTPSGTTLAAKGFEYLQTFKPRYSLEGKAIDTPGQQFGVDYGFGDQVVVRVGRMFGEAIVDAFAVKSSGDEDTIEIALRGEVHY